MVWDTAANIRFRKPRKEWVRAEFRLTGGQVSIAQRKLNTQDPHEPVLFLVKVEDETGDIIAEVQKVLHVRRPEKTA
jgi:hypothetical protein